MYSTCIFCNSRLGANEVVEEFPVGRRLAFDPDKGRLWALCSTCRQWNLSPIEERWEALEALERLYRDTPQRYSTEQIGLAKHREGLEVVRIGQPTRPEYAAWRYGGELMRRRRRTLALGTVGVAAGAVYLGGIGAGLIAGGALNVVNLGAQATNLYRGVFRTAARIEGPDGTSLLLKERHAKYAQLVREDDEWRLRFHYLLDTRGLGRERWNLLFYRGLAGMANVRNDPSVDLTGDDAVRAAGRILPALNRAGASSRVVDDATRFVEMTGTADAAFRKAAKTVPSAWRNWTAPTRSPQSALYRLRAPVRLGLEMAAQEDAERRALEGELDRLEREWREAEEVAAIADDLLLPERVRRMIPGLRKRAVELPTSGAS